MTLLYNLALVACIFSLLLLLLRSIKVLVSELSRTRPERDTRTAIVAAAMLVVAIAGLALIGGSLL